MAFGRKIESEVSVGFDRVQLDEFKDLIEVLAGKVDELTLTMEKLNLANRRASETLKNLNRAVAEANRSKR